MTSSTSSSPPQRSALVRGAALFGPAAVLMVGVKLVEYSTLRRHSLPDFGELLWWNGPLLLLAVLLAGIGVEVIRHRWPRTPIVLQSALGVGLLFGSIAGARALLPPSVVSYMEWTSPTAFEFVRWDLLILLGTGLAGTGLLSLARGI